MCFFSPKALRAYFQTAKAYWPCAYKNVCSNMNKTVSLTASEGGGGHRKEVNTL